MRPSFLPTILVATAVVACTPSTTPVEDNTDSSALSSQAAVGSSFELTLDDHRISGMIPERWGMPTVPATDEFNKILSGSYDGSYINTQHIDASTPTRSVVIENYVYPDPQEYSPAAPAINLMTYPDTFEADTLGDYQAMTGEEKAAIITPLQRVYEQRGLGSLNFTQVDMQQLPAYRGGWWGNGGYRSDRMAVRYVENAAGNLRGLMFFANEGQDYGFFPIYKIALINPAKQVVVTAYLPVGTKFPELAPFDMSNLQDGDEIIRRQYGGYAFLNDPSNYESGELETFVEEAEELVRSINLH